MEIYTNQIKEWTDYENQHKIAVAAVKWLDKSLRIVHGKREKNVELTYGLPYTSSGEYAAIWNTNVDARSNDDLTLQFKGVALDKDNNPVIIWYMTDCDSWKYTTIENENIKNEKENKTMKTYEEKIEAIKNIIACMGESDAVALHNEYCYETSGYDDEIIEMERFDEICEGMTPSDIARSIFYGDFNPNHDYFHYNGYGNFESTGRPTDWIYPGDIAREVVDRECSFENDEIQEEIDSWSEDEEDEEEN